MQLTGIREILGLYSRALSGKDVLILPIRDLAQRGIGWVRSDLATTDGLAIYLPEQVNDYEDEQLNFLAYKVLTTHQAGHFEFGTFDFSFDRPCTQFRDIRPLLGSQSKNAKETLTDLERFFDLFANRRLAEDIFSITEDYRIDELIQIAYAGLRQSYVRAQMEALTGRPALHSLPPKQAIVEGLVRISLGDLTPVFQTGQLSYLYLYEYQIMERLCSPRATVEDSIEAAIRLYLAIARLPSVDGDYSILLSSREAKNASPDEWPGNDLTRFLNHSSASQSTGFSLPSLFFQTQNRETAYQRPQIVGYRGIFKPELVQTILKLREIEYERSGLADWASLSRNLKEMLHKSVEVEIEDIPSSLDPNENRLLANILRYREETQSSPDFGERKQPVRGGQVPVNGSSGEASETGVFRYDEWDYRRKTYIPSWCQVTQRVIESENDGYFDEVQQRYANLVVDVKRQFERLRMERLRKMKRLFYGDEFDLDSVIEAIVERRAGAPISGKLYSKRSKIERDVAVLVLLDMSGSTSEPIERVNHKDGYREAGMVIDVEKESLVVMAGALETIGDKYGIFGFSGHGRNGVDFLVVKDFSEGLSQKTKSRFNKIRPLHATRMGPAIRHAIWTLCRQEAKLKLLILLSDGRPRDFDYGVNLDGEDTKGNSIGDHIRRWSTALSSSGFGNKSKLYALHDTKMALLEAKGKGIVPFCLTIDRFGHDYLKIMCADIGYEVLDSIQSLPERLPGLYRSLAS